MTDRNLSPQRIVHYREGWYLDAWDDDKDALRSFAIDRIRGRSWISTTSCRDVYQIACGHFPDCLVYAGADCIQ